MAKLPFVRLCAILAALRAFVSRHGENSPALIVHGGSSTAGACRKLLASPFPQPRIEETAHRGLPFRPGGRADRRHHFRHCRHRLVDHADAGAGLSIRAEASGSDHGGRRRDGKFFAHPRLVARGRLARLPGLFGDGHSCRRARRAHAACAALACRRYRHRRCS